MRDRTSCNPRNKYLDSYDFNQELRAQGSVRRSRMLRVFA